MMQKIKYPVGSTIDSHGRSMRRVVDVTKNEKICFLEYMNGELEDEWFTQEKLDKEGYTLVSSPRWKPEVGQRYFFVTIERKVLDDFWRGDKSDIFLLRSENIYKTPEECQKKIDEINSREI